MSQWLPALDDALGGIDDLLSGGSQTAGDALGSFTGGLLSPLANFIIKLALIGGAIYLLAGWL